MNDFHERLLKLRSALLDLALSVLPPNADPASPDVSAEAALIFGVLASTPVPPKTTDYAINVSAMLDRKTASAMSLLGLARAFGITSDARAAEDAKPVLGVVNGKKVVMNEGVVRLSVSDGEVRSFHVHPIDSFDAVVTSAKDMLGLLASKRGGSMLRVFDQGADRQPKVVRDGRVYVSVGGPLAAVIVRAGDSLDRAAFEVKGALEEIAERHVETVEQPAKSKPVLGVRDGHMVVLGAGRLIVRMSDGNQSVVNVPANGSFVNVVNEVKGAVLSFAESMDVRPIHLLGYHPTLDLALYALVNGKITIGVEDGPEIAVTVTKGEKLGQVLTKVHGAVQDLAELHREKSPLFGMREGRFTTLRAGKLVLGEAWTEGAPISVAAGESLERVLDKLKEALVYRAGGTVVKAPVDLGNAPSTPAPTGNLYVKAAPGGAFLLAGTALIPDAPLPKGRAEVLASDRYYTGDPIPCAWKGEGSWPTTNHWIFATDSLPKGIESFNVTSTSPVTATAPSAPEAPKGVAPAATPILGIVDGQAAVLRDGDIWLGVQYDGDRATFPLYVRKAFKFSLFAGHLVQRLTDLAKSDNPGPFMDKPDGYKVVKSGRITLSDGTRTVGFPIHGYASSFDAVTAQLRDLAVLLAAWSRPVNPDYKGLGAVVQAAAGPLAPESFDSVKVIFTSEGIEATGEFSAAQVRTILAGGDPWPKPAAPAPTGVLYGKMVSEGVTIAAGTILRHRNAHPKGHAEVTYTTRYHSGASIPCMWRGEGPWPTDITRWEFDPPIPGVAIYATSTPEP